MLAVLLASTKGIVGFKQGQCGLDFREKSLDFLALVRTRFAGKLLHELLLLRKQLLDRRHGDTPDSMEEMVRRPGWRQSYRPDRRFGTGGARYTNP